jgi:MFS family permease
MSKLKLSCGTIAILLMCLSFNCYFALTALSKQYAKIANTHDQLLGTANHNLSLEIDIFISRELITSFLIFLVGSLSIVMAVTRRTPEELENGGSLKKVGWQLFLVNITTLLIVLGKYIYDYTMIAPVVRENESGIIDVVVEITTTLAISVLLFNELFILLIKLLQNSRTQMCFQSSTVDPSSIRPAVFLFLFGVDLSAAFVPLHMKNLYQPIYDLPKDVVLGLPISSMFLCVSFTIVIAGIWLDRRGWHEPFLVGLGMMASAMLYAWLSPNAIHFIIAMGLAGLGYGLALMAAQGFVIVHTDEKTKALSLANLFAGMYAGSICGTAFGAMLADRTGYGPVFLLSALTLLLTLGYILLTMRCAIKQSQLLVCQAKTGQVIAAVTACHYWNFLRNRYVLGLIFLSSLPSAIAVIGLLNYFGPVYLDRLGVSQSVIGSVLILYSICMVYLGPFVSKYIDASDNKRLFVFIGCVLGGGAFLSFHFFTGLTATVIAVLLLGVSSCFVLASQTTYALTLEVTKQLGQGRAIGIFRASSRIGQMLGPILFGWLMVSTDINKGLTYFGIAYLATAVIFFLLTYERIKYREKVICESSPAASR